MFYLQVNLNMDDGRSLGLMIRGGAEYGLGIYITGVDPGSAADAGALKVLPQCHGKILHCNTCPTQRELGPWTMLKSIVFWTQVELGFLSPMLPPDAMELGRF